jgi:phosphoglycolate phosphatase-like HAD superfamily hydrolase
LEGYSKIKLPNGEAYVREISMKKIADANSIVFDCDGVLIDASKSYNKAISETVSYLLGIFFGNKIKASPITEDVIFAFRKTGGFNNDWNTTYIVIMFVMSKIPEQLFDAYSRIFKKANRQEAIDPYARLGFAKRAISNEKLGIVIDRRITNELIDFAGKLDFKGLQTAEKIILKGSAPKVRMLKLMKRFLCYPEDVTKSIIVSVFDEHFYGKLFKKVHGIDAKLGIERGTIENERLLIEKATLSKLEEKFDRSIGMATGRGSIGTFFTLGKVKDYLNPKALVFLEDIDPKDLEKKYGKPEPYALLKSSEPFANGASVIYVGDSAEDSIMARRANKTKEFIFAAICGRGSLSEKKFDMFYKQKADIIASSVNDIPLILERVKN